MISFWEAFGKVMETARDWGVESIPLFDCTGRILAEKIEADRDFPPFDRSTKDGIALRFSGIGNGGNSLDIAGVLSAGMPRQRLEDAMHCYEIMTGAVVPEGADTVVMYEELEIGEGKARLKKRPRKGQNIHVQGSDATAGTVLLCPSIRITPAEIGILATVGKDRVKVKRLPKVCTISTGNELVEISETPEPHQIRRSNTASLQTALADERISVDRYHLPDDKDTIARKMAELLDIYDVLMLSGGVSKGKFDYIPQVFDDLGVEKYFHRVAQRPGKPFWFGESKRHGTVVFSFPGNPVSTFVNYHLYFLPWLFKGLGAPFQRLGVLLEAPVDNTLPLTLFVQVKTRWRDGCLVATPIRDGGSGDLASLSRSDGFILLEPRESTFAKGEQVPFIPSRAMARVSSGHV